MLGRPDPRQLQDVRRVDRPRRQDHLARRLGLFDDPAAGEFDAGRTLAVEQNAMHLRLSDDLQIGPLHRRAQIGARGTRPAAAAAGLLAPADAVAGAGGKIVDVLAVFEADLAAGLDDCFTQRRAVHLRGKERAANAANLALAAFPILGLFEKGQDVVPRPTAITELRPMIEILGLAADIDQAVDRTRAAEHPAARVEDRATGGAGVGLSVITPGQGRVIEQFHKAGRDVDVGAPIAPAGLDQQDARGRVLGEAVGEHAAGRAGADDYIIGLHQFPPTRSHQPRASKSARPPRSGCEYLTLRRLAGAGADGNLAVGAVLVLPLLPAGATQADRGTRRRA